MQQSFRDRRAAAQIPADPRGARRASRSSWSRRPSDQQRLRLAAPVAGTVLPPPLTPRRDDPDEKLPAWSGTPLDPENLGACLEQGVLFCQVGDPKRLEAVLVVDQADRNLIRDGNSSVDIKLEGFACHHASTAQIAEIAESELKVTPQRLSTKSRRRTAHQDRSAHRRREADEHLLPGPRADRRSRRAVSAGPARPGPRLHRLDFARRTASGGW